MAAVVTLVGAALSAIGPGEPHTWYTFWRTFIRMFPLILAVPAGVICQRQRWPLARCLAMYFVASTVWQVSMLALLRGESPGGELLFSTLMSAIFTFQLAFYLVLSRSLNSPATAPTA